jgi:hypothetical protein
MFKPKWIFFPFSSNIVVEQKLKKKCNYMDLQGHIGARAFRKSVFSRKCQIKKNKKKSEEIHVLEKGPMQCSFIVCLLVFQFLFKLLLICCKSNIYCFSPSPVGLPFFSKKKSVSISVARHSPVMTPLMVVWVIVKMRSPMDREWTSTCSLDSSL